MIEILKVRIVTRGSTYIVHYSSQSRFVSQKFIRAVKLFVHLYMYIFIDDIHVCLKCRQINIKQQTIKHSFFKKKIHILVSQQDRKSNVCVGFFHINFPNMFNVTKEMREVSYLTRVYWWYTILYIIFHIKVLVHLSDMKINPPL